MKRKEKKRKNEKKFEDLFSPHQDRLSAFGTWTARFANAILHELEDINSLTFTVGACIVQILK